MQKGPVYDNDLPVIAMASFHAYVKLSEGKLSCYFRNFKI
jgi:hypothetical protein